MVKSAALFFCCAALACAQCPAKGDIDANSLSATRLLPSRMADEIRRAPLAGYVDLQALAAKYGYDLPKELVVCTPPPVAHAAAAVDSVDTGQDSAVNVNSASERELKALTFCGVTDADIREIALVNQKGVRFNEKSFRTFLANQHAPRNSAICNRLTFKYNSR